MFTGLVEEKGRLKTREGSRDGAALVIQASRILEGMKTGDSIAVNGVCLTVTAVGADSFTAAVMPETMRKTGLASLSPGESVNLERALALGSRLGGHMVSGHVDGNATLTQKRREGNATILRFTAPPSLLRYIITKGSVAVDGVSLTVASVDKRGFSVSLIPHTAAESTLGHIREGAAVNLETDMIGKYVEKLLQPYPGVKDPGKGVTAALLEENGFL